MRDARHLGRPGIVACAACTALVFAACGTLAPPPDENVANVTSAVINGSADANGDYAAVAAMVYNGVGPQPPGGCSAFYVGYRTMITAGHCVPCNAPGCTAALGCAPASLAVRFARKNGGYLGNEFEARLTDAESRTIPVVAVVANPASLITTTQCPAAAANLCAFAATNNLSDRSKEATLLFLKYDVPDDGGSPAKPIEPLPLLLDAAALPTPAGDPDSVAKLAAWAGANDPTQNGLLPKFKVTTVGYGVGSSDYSLLNPPLPPGFIIGRNYGVTTWEGSSAAGVPYDTEFNLAFPCTVKSSGDARPAIVVSPLDLLASDAPLPPSSSAGGPSWTNVTPGQTFSNAAESLTGAGDSGGPVLVGVGPASRGAVPTPLPTPVAPGDSYDPARHYAAGIAAMSTSDVAGPNGPRPAAAYSPLFLPSTSKFLQKALHDTDGDGIADAFDKCPWGDDKIDTDGDTIPDCADLCKCDPNPADQDSDMDGFCAVPCPGEPADLCPSVFNVGMANSNGVSESAQKAKPLADGCEPACAVRVNAPVAVVSEQVAKLGPQGQLSQVIGVYDRSTLGMKGLASHNKNGDAFVPPGTVVETTARFCQANAGANITCIDPILDITDDALTAPPGGAASAVDEGGGTHFHRMTLLAPDGTTLVHRPDTFYLPYDNPDFALADLYAKYTWCYNGNCQGQPSESDYAFWTRPNGGWFSGKPDELAGNLWIHTLVPWGGASGFTHCPGALSCNLGSGIHLSGFATELHQLNNFYFKGTADEPELKPSFSVNRAAGSIILPTIPIPGPSPEVAHLVVRPAPTRSVGAFAAGPPGAGAAAILVAIQGGGVGALSPVSRVSLAEVVTTKLGANLQTAFASGASFVAPAEPSRAIGAGPAFPIGVTLSATGDQLTTVVRSSGASLSAAGDGPLCAAPGAPSPPAVIRTFGSFGSGPGQLSSPVGVGVDASGNTFVTDRDNHRVCKFGPTGAFLFCWGQSGSGDGEFGGAGATGYGPYGLEVDKGTGMVCVADTINARVQCFDGLGRFLFKFGSSGVGPGQFAAEMGIGFDPQTHDIYVADTFGHRVQVFDRAGNYLRQWGTFGSAPAELGYPRDVAVDVRGNVYVAEHGNHRISKFDRLGTFVAAWGSFGTAPGLLQNPHGVAVDAGGLVYVADLNNSRVQVFSPTGGLVTLWGGQGTAEGQFQGAIGVDLDAAGAIFVSDHFTNRVQVFAPIADACTACPSGRCIAGQPGVCCEQACTAASDCATGYCSVAGRCDLPPRTGSPHATGFVPVLTAYRRGVFVVGGDDPTSHQPVGEIWFAAIDGARWGKIVTPGYEVARVLAATYSFASDRLYVLDEKAGSARLTAIDPIARTATTMGTWPSHSSWDHHYLVLDRDGGLLLASSNGKKHKHVLSRIDVRKTPVAVSTAGAGNRALLMEPVVDDARYTLLLRKQGDGGENDGKGGQGAKQKKGDDDDDGPNGGDARIKLQSVPYLALKPAQLADLGDQL